MTITEGEPAAGAAEPVTDHATLQLLQRRLGEHLGLYRRAAGRSQTELARALGRTRSALSKIEHGHRTMPAELWTLADQVCGTLVAEHNKLTTAQRSYRGWCQTQHRQAQQQAAQVQLEGFQQTAPAPVTASDAALDLASLHLWLANGAGSELAGELIAVVERLVRSLGRREAMRVAGYVLSVLGISAGLDLDPDEHTRLIHAVEAPREGTLK